MTSFNHNHNNQHEHKAKLERKLAEDLATTENISDYARMLEKLNTWKTPNVSQTATARLIEQLEAELSQSEAKSPTIPGSLRMRLRWGLLLIASQLRVVQRELWLASAVVMMIGTLVTLATHSANFNVLPIVLIAPVVAAAGVAFVYGPLNDPVLEIELAAPVSPRMIALTRITLVFGFNFMLALAGSAFLVLSGVGLTFMPLISAWLAPMAMLSALAFLLSVLFFDPLVSMMFSVIVWVTLSLRRYMPIELHPLLTALLDLLIETRPLVWLLTLVMVTAGVWLIGDGERWVGILER